MQGAMRTREPRKERPAHARSCAGCGARAERPSGGFELVRFALLPDGEAVRAVVDLGASSFGRGVWVHPTRKCLEQAARRGFSRSARREVRAEADELCRQIAAAADKRAADLVGVGVRSKKAVIGLDAAKAAGRVVLWLCAADASAKDSSEVAEALARGQALVFGSKESLGAACGRELVGTVAFTDAALAGAVRDAIVLSQAAATIRGGISKQ